MDVQLEELETDVFEMIVDKSVGIAKKKNPLVYGVFDQVGDEPHQEVSIGIRLLGGNHQRAKIAMTRLDRFSLKEWVVAPNPVFEGEDEGAMSENRVVVADVNEAFDSIDELGEVGFAKYCVKRADVGGENFTTRIIGHAEELKSVDDDFGIKARDRMPISSFTIGDSLNAIEGFAKE